MIKDIRGRHIFLDLSERTLLRACLASCFFIRTVGRPVSVNGQVYYLPRYTRKVDVGSEVSSIHSRAQIQMWLVVRCPSVGPSTLFLCSDSLIITLPLNQRSSQEIHNRSRKNSIPVLKSH